MNRTGFALALALTVAGGTPAFGQQYGSYSQTYINGNPVYGRTYPQVPGVTIQVGPGGVQAYPNTTYGNPYSGQIYPNTTYGNQYGGQIYPSTTYSNQYGGQIYPSTTHGNQYGVQQPGINRTTVYSNIPGTNLPNPNQPAYTVDTLPDGTQTVYPIAPQYGTGYQQVYPSTIQPGPNGSYGLRQPSVNSPASSGMRQP